MDPAHPYGWGLATADNIALELTADGHKAHPYEIRSVSGGLLPPGPFVGRIALLPRVLVRGSIRLNVETLRSRPSRGQEAGEIGLFIRTAGF